MRCDVVRFVAFEDLGTWEAEIAAHGYEVRYLEAGVDDPAPLADADLGIVLGAPIDADDEARYPWLATVKEALAARLAADLPTLGICLGAQLISLVLGGELTRGNREVGWAPLTLLPDAAQTPVRHLAGVPVLHWHQDVASVPDGATLLANSSLNPNQAFAHGNSLALQFHPEADPEMHERWLIGHAGDLARWGFDLADLRAQRVEHGDTSVMAGIAMIREYLRSL
ncbi:glutamine amidotransferase-related protein [Demequina sp.]|uniref:glutamine amidotransferase-related protein n=1 Tax=Demequina sp. TaxID=2050685 RepID=UPI003D0D0011